MNVHNNNCDGSHCQSATGEVRRLPTGGDGAAILCYDCFRYEMQYRRQMNEEKWAWNPAELPTWESLKVYGGDE